MQFDQFRITLIDLNRNSGIRVKIGKTQSDDPTDHCQESVVQDDYIKYNEPLLFSDRTHDYKVNLVAIDHAGKNPFKLAAYINLETLK
ncbi:hypothetical protein Cpin_4282 [Chitinophaga pinensis DSM 2588]|uniref:Uncharacterized protein n=1 Tax=Chitinophaga pinensis (strain ATCC 43595 / DSM 2588 / LMG 13176 / NBRC 15968 / NCIMB 11800 / UQM 2034) TaxID=485918 RepID=A0A979GWG0_CHIPD|nr:hypothetical protein Cpin_4282 [Chitinophaga pinensis DSM 2588]